MARYADADDVPKVEASKNESGETKTVVVSEFDYLINLVEQRMNLLDAKLDKIIAILEK